MVVYQLALKHLRGIFQETLTLMLPKSQALAAAGTPVSPNRSVGRRYAGPEEAEVLELGAKILLPSGYLNIAVFDQTIDGFQSNTFIGTGFCSC